MKKIDRKALQCTFLILKDPPSSSLALESFNLLKKIFLKIQKEFMSRSI